MRWQLVDHGWPVGQHYIEVGTIIDERFINPVSGLPLPLPLPLNAWCCDQEALALMRRWYHPDLWHRLRYDPHSVRPR
jgi:hypothetical protein